ncbi:PrgI family protein [Nocardioides sambongensis]|uniref:PrgI family protein n=1 Tax=Nocardioides sambongensis TaxID=2589074 RepID=UPI001126A637|nr:PrgI family protein [Nocardioides sambongensis]
MSEHSEPHTESRPSTGHDPGAGRDAGRDDAPGWGSGPVDGASRPAPRRTATVVCAVIALVVAVAQVVAAAALWIATDNDTTDDPLVGLGYVLAMIVGAPGVLGLLCGVPALLLARRPGGLTLAVLALVAVGLPVAFFLFLAVPTLGM